MTRGGARASRVRIGVHGRRGAQYIVYVHASVRDGQGFMSVHKQAGNENEMRSKPPFSRIVNAYGHVPSIIAILQHGHAARQEDSGPELIFPSSPFE